MSDALRSRPGFGQRLMQPSYYEKVDTICRALKPMGTLREIASHLAQAGLKTPAGRDWDRQRVAAYLRHRSI